MTRGRGDAETRRIGVFGNPYKPDVSKVVERFARSVRSRGVELVVAEDLRGRVRFDGAFCPSEELATRADLVIAFGGDGTILRAAAAVGRSGVPILGINLGRLGFLAEVTPQELDRELERLLSGAYRIEPRMALEIRLGEPAEPVFALNDCVIGKGLRSRVIEIETFVSGLSVSAFAGDGMIVSTPTGSTGYCLSSGGPVVHPQMDVLIVVPICPHSLSMRPLIVPSDQSLTVRVRADHDHMILDADGRTISTLNSGDQVRLRRADHVVNLVKLKELSFYDVLRQKLGWSLDHRFTSER